MKRQVSAKGLAEAAAKSALICLAFLVLAAALVLVIGHWNTVRRANVERWHESRSEIASEDYTAFYAGAYLLRQGRGDELYEVEAIAGAEQELMGRPVGNNGVLVFLNPPFVALVTLPTAWLGPRGAAIAFGTIASLSVLIAVALMAGRYTETRNKAAVVVASLLFAPVTWVILHGQYSAIIVVGFLIYLRMRRSNHTLAGSSLALTLFKPQFAVLPILVLIARREWRQLRGFALVAIPLVVLSVPISGAAVFWEYPAFLYESTTWDDKWGNHPEWMYGWHGFFSRFTGHGSTALWLLSTASIVATLGLLSLTLNFSRIKRVDQSEAVVDREWAAILLAGLLVSNHLYYQDLVVFGLALHLLHHSLTFPGGERRIYGQLTMVVLIACAFTISLRAQGINIITPLVAVTYLVVCMDLMLQREAVRRWIDRARIRTQPATAPTE